MREECCQKVVVTAVGMTVAEEVELCCQLNLVLWRHFPDYSAIEGTQEKQEAAASPALLEIAG